MMTNFEKVKEFMQTFNQKVRKKPEMPSVGLSALRIDLIEEELQELIDAVKAEDIVEIADALTDILYVTYGAGASVGIDLDACVTEVHRSNMTKLDPETQEPIYREDGKVLKGRDYEPPNLERVLFDRIYDFHDIAQ